jgi:multiple sugar transport system substrate-binding protein
MNKKLLTLSFCLTLVMVLFVPFSVLAKTEIDVWCGWSLLVSVFEEAADDFEDETGIKVNVVAYPLREFERKLAVAIPAGNAPDIFVTSEYIIPQYINAGYVAEPPKEIEDFILNNFDSLTLKLNTFDGKVYGVPQVGIARVLYWNTKMFEEAGIEGPPETWDELIEYAQKLTVRDDKGNILRGGISLRKFGGGSGVTEKFQILLASAGGKIIEEISDGKWRAVYNNEAGRKTLKLYIDLIHKYNVDGFDIKQDAEAFVLEKTAMFIREFWPIPYFEETNPDLEYDTAFIPSGQSSGASGTVYSTESAFVPESSRNKEAAWDFIMFFNKPKYVKKWFEQEGWPAPRTDIDFSDVYKKYPAFAIANERPDNYLYSTYPPITAADEVWTKLGERLEKAFRNADLVDNPEGIAKVLDDAAQETNQILKDHGLY